MHYMCMLHILCFARFDLLIDCHIIMQLFVTLRTTKDSTRSRRHSLHWFILLLKICSNPQPYRLRHAQSDARCRRASFCSANSGLVFQEVQLIHVHSVPFIHLLYGDKSFFGQHRGHYPIYGTYRKQICNICKIYLIYFGMYYMQRYADIPLISTAQCKFLLF